jgi:hypothetical protein
MEEAAAVEFASPTPLPRALQALAHEAVVTEGGPHPPVEAEPTAPRRARVILAGRATSVPFTAVLNSPERTTTDNHEAASTCTIPCPRRSQQRPNWLWEQGVAGGFAVDARTLGWNLLVVPVRDASAW